MNDKTVVDMSKVRAYADRILQHVPAPDEGDGDEVLVPAFAFATVMLLWASAREDWKKMFSLMKAYHQTITAFHQQVVSTDRQIRKQAAEQAAAAEIEAAAEEGTKGMQKP